MTLFIVAVLCTEIVAAKQISVGQQKLFSIMMKWFVFSQNELCYTDTSLVQKIK